MGNLFPEKKKIRKERTKKQPEYLKTGLCWYDDGTKWKECNMPWADKCNGNIHWCSHLKYKWLASLPENKRNEYIKHTTLKYLK